LSKRFGFFRQRGVPRDGKEFRAMTRSWQVRGFAVVVLIAVASASAKGQMVLSESYNTVLWGPSALPTQFVEFSAAVSSLGTGEFLNVVRNDGTWVVQNLPVGFEPGTHTMSTSINASLVISGATYQTTLSPSIVTAPPVFASGSAAVLGPPITLQSNNSFGVTDFGPLGGPPVAPNTGFTFGSLLGASYHTGVPDLAQGTNQCFPTASANSLTWLDNTYHLGINMTTQQIRDKLVMLMGTTAADGTNLAGYFSGKAAFAPPFGIETHRIIGRADRGPSLANILTEMAKGQDVELVIVFPDGGAHALTLVGILSLGPLGAGIAFNDPADGIDGSAVSWLNPDGDFVYGEYAGAHLAFAAAESFVPEPASLTLMALGLATALCFKCGRGLAVG
jgi:hypothetical protein